MYVPSHDHRLSVCLSVGGSVTPNIHTSATPINQSINQYTLAHTHSPLIPSPIKKVKRLKVEKRKDVYTIHSSHKKRNIKNELFDKNLIPISISRSPPRVLLQKYVNNTQKPKQKLQLKNAVG